MTRLTATISRLDGTEQPIGPAEPAERVGRGIQLTGSMPGGQQTATITVSRDPALRDLDPFDELIVRDTGGIEVWRGYGVEYPARDGDGPEVEISATGWSGYLKDNTPGPLLAVDRKFDSWGNPPAARLETLAASGVLHGKAYTAKAGENLKLTGDEGNPITANQTVELWYRPPVPLASFQFSGTRNNLTGTTNSGFMWMTTDDTTLPASTGMTMDGTVRGGNLNRSTRAVWRVNASTKHTPADGAAFWATINKIAMYGDHNIPLYDNAIDGMKGVLASDVITWGLRQACPLLTANIQTTSFVIPHLREDDLESVEELIQKVNATELFDWGVFGRQFVYRPVGTGRTWVVRSSDPGVTLNDAGPQGADVYSRAIVRYQGVDGRSRTAGYPGSDTDTETALLTSPAPELTSRGRERTLSLSLSATTVAERAIQVGQVALREYARVNQRGDATLTGQAVDLDGVTWNVCHIQAGDQIIIADRGWKPRQIVDLTYSEDDDSCQVSLDSTPSRLDALMERMGVLNEGTGL